MKPRILPFLPLLILAGCRQEAPGYKPTPPPPVPKVSLGVKSAADLMPLAVGNQWEYAMHFERSRSERLLGSADQTVSYEVQSQTNDGEALLVVKQDGNVVDRQDWRANSQSLYQASGGPARTPFTPAQPLALLPLTTGKTFKWSGRGVMPNGKVSQAESTSQIMEPQVVDTKLGPLSAIPILTKTTFTGGASANTAWYRPTVGLVRYRQEMIDASGQHDVITLTLTSYSLK